MNLNDRLKVMARTWLSDCSEQPADLAARRRLQAQDLEDFEDAASAREDPLWSEINTFLLALRANHPIRVQRIRDDIKWLRRQAQKQGIEWGKKR